MGKRLGIAMKGGVLSGFQHALPVKKDDFSLYLVKLFSKFYQ